MAKTNTKTVREPVLTHGGARAEVHMKPFVALERAVATCLLWEDAFYESGSGIAKRIAALCAQVPACDVAALAIKARREYKLRHVPLFLCIQLAALASGREDGLVSRTIAKVIQRPDEMGELVALYWRDKKRPLSAQIKKGLRAAFGKFSEYQFAKWSRDADIQLRDVMFLVSPKPSQGREGLYKAIAEKSLPPADTWEVALTAGKDEKETWERLLHDGKLGYIALLMNLRNMEKAKVDSGLIETALLSGAARSKALPFRFITAAKHAPRYENMLGEAMIAALSEQTRLAGRTILVVDVSGSMASEISAKSELSRVDTACALAILLREICDYVSIYATAGNDYSRVHATELVPPRHTFALRDAIGVAYNKLGGGGIFLTQCMDFITQKEPAADRVIVITDEQDCDIKLSPKNAKLLGRNNYIINVANYDRAIGFDRWTTINGWSERVVDWIVAEENFNSNAQWI